MSYTKSHCQKPEMDWIWIWPYVTAFFGSRLSPMEGYEPPLINSPCLQYKFILMWRGFTKTMPCIYFCHSIDDETVGNFGCY